MTVHIHPSIDSGVKKGSGSFAGGTLVCKCTDKPVKVGIKGDVAHNHACGCTKCWKPEGATFSVVAVVPRENVTVTRERRQAADRRCVGDDPALRLQGLRHAYVRPHREHGASVLRPRLHPSRTVPGRWLGGARVCGIRVVGASSPAFKPGEMDGIRSRLKELGLEPYDCLSPPLDGRDLRPMWRKAKESGLKNSLWTTHCGRRVKHLPAFFMLRRECSSASGRS